MDSNRRILLGGGLFVALSALASVLAYPDLPAQMATHWNASGDVNGTMSRALGVTLVPAIALLVLLLFLVLPRIDPRDSYDAFRDAYDAVALATVAFVAYAHVVVLLANLGYEFSILQALAPGIGAIYVVAGYVTERTEQNWFVGVRTPWTLESEAVWQETNHRVGQLFKVAGVLTVLAVFVPEYAVVLMVVPVVVVVVAAFGYSWWLYRKQAA